MPRLRGLANMVWNMQLPHPNLLRFLGNLYVFLVPVAHRKSVSLEGSIPSGYSLNLIKNNMKLTLEEVKEIARKAHEGQKRRGGADYFEAHILDVWRRVVKYRQAKLENPLESEIQQVALLHDGPEDGGVTLESLREQGVSEWVLKRVDTLTHKKDESYSDYISRVKNDHYAKLIKIADIFSNLSDNPTDRQRAKYIAALEVLLFETA